MTDVTAASTAVASSPQAILVRRSGPKARLVSLTSTEAPPRLQPVNTEASPASEISSVGGSTPLGTLEAESPSTIESSVHVVPTSGAPFPSPDPCCISTVTSAPVSVRTSSLNEIEGSSVRNPISWSSWVISCGSQAINVADGSETERRSFSTV